MTDLDSHAVFLNDWLTEECTNGYLDGRNADCPEPSGNRHPAYVHGFQNGRDDMTVRPRRKAHEARNAWKMIVEREQNSRR